MLYTRILVPVVLLGSLQSRAQDNGPQLVAGYDDVSSGRNLNISWHQPLGKKWQVYGGIKYMLNSRHYKNAHAIGTHYFKAFTAEKAGQRFGPKLGLEYRLWQPNNQLRISAVYDLQWTKANVTWGIKYWFDDTSYFEDGGVPWTVSALEQSLGLNAEIRISSRFDFLAHTSIGFNIYNEYLRTSPSAFTRSFRFSLAYKIQAQVTPQAFQFILPARKSVALTFDDIQTGRTLNVSYRRGLNVHHSVYGGVKVQINSRFFDDHTRMRQSYYFKQFRAEGFTQHLGLKAGYEYGIPIPRSNLYFFCFYDIQLSRAVVRNLAQLVEFHSGPRGSSSPMGQIGYTFYGNPLFTGSGPSYRYCGPVTALENYIGIGARMGITDRVRFRIQAGIGYNFYSGPANYDPYYVYYQMPGSHQYFENVPFKAPSSELSKMFSLGLEYTLQQ